MHESVMVYGGARRISWVGSWAYAHQFGLDSINIVLSNMYGRKTTSTQSAPTPWCARRQGSQGEARSRRRGGGVGNREAGQGMVVRR